MLLYRRKIYFTAICTLLKNSRHFRTKYSMFAELQRKLLQCKSEHKPGTAFVHFLFTADYFYQRRTSYNKKFNMKTITFLKMY
jgi:hypothetical protein